MHRCLQIPEVVYLIVQTLSCHPRVVITRPAHRRVLDREDTNALLSLSLTSKSFLETCLDSLWGCLSSVEPLLNLFIPPDSRPSLEEAYSPTHASIADLIKSIDETCWGRIHYYADRIKGLRVGVDAIDPLMSRALSTWPFAHGTPLLPNLLYLHWEPISGLYPCLQMFSGPSLTTLKLTAEAWPEESDGLVYPVLVSFCTACPALTTLEIEDGNEVLFDDSGRQFSLVLAAFPSITKIGCWIKPHSDELFSLATMQNLHTVVNHMYASASLPRPETASPRLPFPTLRVLRWTVYDFKDATALLTQLQPGPRDLRGLALRCNDRICDPSDMSALLAAIRAMCAPQTLTALSLENASLLNPYAHVRPALAAPSLAATLRPFGRMQERRLAALPIVLDDDLLDTLSRAWPALRRLELLAKLPDASMITLAGLQILADRCPHLRHLEAAVGAWPGDDAGPDPLQNTAATGTGRSARLVVAYCADLKTLDVGHRARRVALMRGVFPHAQLSLGNVYLPRWKGCDLGEDILADLV